MITINLEQILRSKIMCSFAPRFNTVNERDRIAIITMGIIIRFPMNSWEIYCCCDKKCPNELSKIDHRI